MTESQIETPRRLEIPEGDLRWPLGGWLRRTPDEMPQDLGPKTKFGATARYSGPKGLRVIATIDLTPYFGALLHTSLSYANRDPSWIEIKAMREVFFPSDVDAMMMLPAEQNYVNVQEHCFHVVQTPTAWNMR